MTNTVRVDGWPVAPGTAAAFLTRLKPAFEKQFPGVTLHVYSGYRSYEDQVAIFTSRYARGAASPFGDYRYWQGARWGRTSGEGTVAVPGTSNHMSGTALDIRDSGTDAGVTTAGKPRATWIRLHAAEYGFTPIGYTFGEPWHIEYTGAPWEGGSAAGGGSSANDNEEEWLMAAADDVKWTKDRIGGSTKDGASLTSEVRDLRNKVAEQQAELDAVKADVIWLKDRVGGKGDGPSITEMLRTLLKG